MTASTLALANLYTKAQLVNINVPSDEVTPDITPNTSRPPTPGGQHTAGSIHKGSRKSRKAAAALAVAANQSSGDEARRSVKSSKGGAKKMRKWNADGLADDADDTVLDYSAAPSDTNGGIPGDGDADPAVDDVNTEDFGSRNAKGDFVLKDLDSRVDAILRGATHKSEPSEAATSAGLGAISGFFRNIVGGKTLTKADLEKPMKAMQEHLLNKNVAQEAAVRLCESAERELTGVKTGSFERE